MQVKSDAPAPGGENAGSGRSATRPRLTETGLDAAARSALNPQEAAKMIERLRNLCLTKGDDISELDEVTRLLRKSGYKQELSQVFREAIWWPEVHPHVGALWMRRLLWSNNWDRRYPEVMDQLCRQGEIGRRAVIEFLETVPAKNRRALVREALRKHGRWLRKDAKGWGVAARALVAVRLYSQAAKWMADWRKQPELDLPLLRGLALALRGAGKEKRAQEVIQLALVKQGVDPQFSIFHLWQAQEDALMGNSTTGAAHFKEVHPEGWDDDSLVLYYLVRGLIRVQRASPDSRGDAFRSAYHRILDQLGRRRIYKCDTMLRRQYRRCMWRMGRDSGNIGGALVACWQSADSGLSVIPLLLVPGLQLFLPLYLLRLCTNRRGQLKRAV